MHKIKNSSETVYSFIVNYFKENGYASSIRKINSRVGLKSTSKFVKDGDWNG